MDKIKWIIFAVAVVAAFAGIIFFSKKDEVAFTGDASAIITEGPIADHVEGRTENPKVTLIEYGDFQCPGCGNIFPVVKELKDEYKDQLTFIFRNMPLTNLHPNALAAATAAEAAGLQGKYFEMHDLLFQTQPSWSGASASERTQIFENYAQQLGLNLDQYKSDVSKQEITTKINRDISTGRNNFSVNSTPTFILNGQKISSNADELRKAVREAVQAAYPDQAQVPQQ